MGKLFLLLFLMLLGGCSGNQFLESRFAPNPNLNSNISPQNGNITKNPPVNNNPSSPNQQNPVELSTNFPKNIPIYEPANLIKVEENKAIWKSPDPLNLIISYYQQELSANNWQINQTEENIISAVSEDKSLTLNLSFTPQNSETEFIITYGKTTDNQTNNSPPLEAKLSLSSPLQELVRLEVIPNGETVNPHDIITRRQYARWLVSVNNLIFKDTNGNLIRLANPTRTPLFSDVPTSDPDFPFIQGLAEAGLIPSSLLQQSSAIAFRPDEPLTREDLIAWKVPLDFRQKLPTVTIDSIKESWGFRDTNDISPQVWGELYLDWQNGEASNIRKAFGYITLFQPKKTVTLEEAAAVLNSFGRKTDMHLTKNVNISNNQ